MCYFLIVSCKKNYQQPLEELLGSYCLRAIAPLDWLSPWHPEDVAFWLTDGFCACNLFSPIHPALSDPEAYRQKQWRKFSKPKYRKQGWTKDKIEHKVKDELGKMQQNPDSGLSRALLACLHHQHPLPRIGLWVQWGDRLPQTLGDRPLKVTLKDLMNHPKTIQENIFYDIICQAQTNKLNQNKI